MASTRVTVDIFGEDAAHERVLKRLVERIGQEEGLALEVRVRSARGGRARAITEYEAYQVAIDSGLIPGATADVLVVAIDGNCTSFAQMRERIRNRTREGLRHLVVAACPDPHVERWILSDPQAFQDVVGAEAVAVGSKCERGYYKKLLADAVGEAGFPATLGGFEFLSEIVDKMDLFRAGKNDASLRSFVGDLRSRLREITHRS